MPLRPLWPALLLAFGILTAGHGSAQESTPTAREDIPTLPTVTVIGEMENPAGGRSTLDGTLLRRLPQGNGTLTELLTILPDVQVSDTLNSSRTAGEILQPGVSISGGKFYQNNFFIDGIGNTSLLDPAGAGNDLVNEVAGHPFERSLSTQLIERVSVYDSNVPARYGGFTGGVIDARIRPPATEFGGTFGYRTTRSDWTRLHLSEADRAELAAGTRTDLQPRFRKESYTGHLDLPLTSGLGLLLGYGELTSDIPQRHLGGTANQQRRQRDGLAKLTWNPTADDHLEISISSTPYRTRRQLRNVLGSEFTQTLEGTSLQGTWSHFVPQGEARLAAGWRHSRQRREGPQHFRNWAVTDSKNWGRLVASDNSADGGFGNLDKHQDSVDLKASFAWEPLRLGSTLHSFTVGVELNRTSAGFERRQTSYAYQGARLSPDILCGDNRFDCVENEQFFTERLVYPAAETRALIRQGALFLEDVVRWGRLELHPGLRLDYDDLMHRINPAPRLAAGFDLFGNRATLLQAGLNRYYGQNLLTAKLREAKLPFRSESRAAFRNRPLAWEAAAAQGTNLTRFSTLDTPYSDELALGVDQTLLGGRLSLKYVLRENRDELTSSYGPLQADGLRRLSFNNLGRSRHEAWRLGWERNRSDDQLSLNATYQETRSNHTDYDDRLGQENAGGQVWFGDRLIPLDQLPGRDYNRPWRINLAYTTKLPRGFSFTNITRYRTGYRSVEATGQTRALPDSEARPDPFTGEPIFETREVYAETRHGRVITFDWRLDWQSPAWHGRQVQLTLEADNLFNTRSRTAGSGEAYELGRRFWLGAQYHF